MDLTGAEKSNLSEVLLEDGNSVESNHTTRLYPYFMRPETYIVPVVFSIIFVIGVLGNGTIIVIFLKFKTMRNVPNL